MKNALWKRVLSLGLGALMLFSLSLTALGAGEAELSRDWKRDQEFTLADPAPWNLEELKQVVDVRDPRSVAAYWIWSLNRLVADYDDGMEMMKYLFADLEPYGDGFTEGGSAGQAGWDSYFNERLDDPDYRWLPRAFFEGATAENGFLLDRPLTLELYFNEPNTKNINEQGEVFGRTCIEYWVMSHAGGNQVNLTLMRFSGSDRWYVTSGSASAAVFYDQRSAITTQQLELAAAGESGDGSAEAEHVAFYGEGMGDPGKGDEPEQPSEPEEPEEPEVAYLDPALAALEHFAPVNTYREGQYPDVAPGFWGTANIAKAFELDLMKGTGDGFDPDGNVTVAQAIAMAARIHSIYETGSADFVQGSPWYQVYVDYAEKNQLLSESFSADDYNRPATRRQFAAILAFALPAEALPEISDIGFNAIPDVQEWDQHANAIYRLYRAGILTGNDEQGTFTPEASISRAAAAAIVTRMADTGLRRSITLD
ncbi:MAG: S-layer homology domain-containing protein [Oscillospiraceae bacterium]|nr:S-layer homology domain-containing protein [Oscillospiraceae bacterium]